MCVLATTESRETRFLDSTLLVKLRKIKQAYGQQKPFLQKAQIRPETLSRICRDGYAVGSVVERIKAALQEREITPSSIVEGVAREYGFTDADALRASGNTEAKRVAAFALHKGTRCSLSEIAALAGQANKAAANNAINKLSDEMDTNRALRKKVWNIVARVTG